MIAVFRRELASYFKGVIGYLFSAFLLVFAGFYTLTYNLAAGQPNFEYVLQAISFIYMICVPILTMRAMAEEKRQKTDQLLYTLPIRLSSVVIGKYFAMLAVLAIPLLIMGTYPLILMQFGEVYLPTAYGTLIAFFLLGATLIALGLFISTLTESQVSSAVICLVLVLFLYFMSDLASILPTSPDSSVIALCVLAALFALILYMFTKNWIVALVVGIVGIGGLCGWYVMDMGAFYNLFPEIFSALSVFERFYLFVNGAFDLTAVVYYLSIIAVFLFLSAQALEKRRWSE